MRRCSISWPVAGSELARTARAQEAEGFVWGGQRNHSRWNLFYHFFIVGAVMKNPEQHHSCHRWCYFYVFFHECKKVICYSTNITENPVQMELLTCCGYKPDPGGLSSAFCLFSSCSDGINLRPCQAFITNQMQGLIPKITVSPLLFSPAFSRRRR